MDFEGKQFTRSDNRNIYSSFLKPVPAWPTGALIGSEPKRTTALRRDGRTGTPFRLNTAPTCWKIKGMSVSPTGRGLAGRGGVV